MQNLISIVIPVYNAECYLKKCIDSILAQSYTEWELLLVNDGSFDASGAICNEYADKDSRIQHIQIENAGACHARNIGIEKSDGEFIMFMDADDILAPDALQTCISKMLSNTVDIVCAECQSVHEDGSPYDYSRPFVEERVISGSDFLQQVLTYNTLCSIWAKLYKRDAIGECRFDENVRRGQDVIFWSTLLPHSDLRILLCNDRIYYYRILENSISHGKVSNQIVKLKELINNFDVLSRANAAESKSLMPYFSYAICYNYIEILTLQGWYKTLTDEEYNQFVANFNTYVTTITPIPLHRSIAETPYSRVNCMLTRKFLIHSFKKIFKSIIRWKSH